MESKSIVSIDDLSLNFPYENELSTTHPLPSTKVNFTNISTTPRCGYVAHRIAENWEEIQDKILRVLNYKYFDPDMELVYLHTNSFNETTSRSSMEKEEIIEIIDLQEYANLENLPVEIQVAHEYLPIAEQAQIIFLDETVWDKAWRRLKSICTLKSCRSNSE